MSSTDADAVVIGAGPAGSAAAAVLAEAGRRVLLVEKDRFPREKVCGELLAPGARTSLERIGALAAVESVNPERMTRGTLHLSQGSSVDFDLPEAALGVSRRVLDALLAGRARELGAEVRFGTRVSEASGSPGAFVAQMAGPAGRVENVRARVVVGAWGRWDALDRRLRRGFVRQPRYFGFNRDYAGGSAWLSGRVHLYLFPGGYCGLSLVEGGLANLAGVVSESARASAGSAWENVVAVARRANAALDQDLARLREGPRGFLGTVPVFFTAKPPVEDGMLMAGDAAGVLDPFSGQGQAAALASGILAGDAALEFLEGRVAAADLLLRYERAWRRRFAPRFAWSAVSRKFMLDSRWAGPAARLAGKTLVRLAIRRLWGGTDSERPVRAS